MPKIVINTCYGGFGLSDAAFQEFLHRKGVAWELVKDGQWQTYYAKGHAGDDNYYISEYDYYENRTDADLVDIVETMGKEANGWAANLKVVDVPDDVDWYLDEYDGIEWVAERHRTWK